MEWRCRVHFTQYVFSDDNPLLREVVSEGEDSLPRKVFFVVDEALAASRPDLVSSIEAYCEAHSDALRLVTSPLLIEGGERVKNSYFSVSQIHSRLEKFAICRHSYLIVVGGGALLDVVGLAAATAHRGVRHIRIPTTTLSQDDSGVGVKNGINAFGKKNFIGTFAPPHAVINDFRMLDTLPEREKRCGFSEAVKVALIRDGRFFDELESMAGRLANFEAEAMQRLIFRSAELHLNHIATSGDPFEFGSARPLDFGHWAAHKLEQLSNYEIRHGEAVAIGIALDTLYSQRMGHLEMADAERILKLLETLGFDLFAPEMLLTDAAGQLLVVKGMEEFREHLGGRLTITLIRGIGTGFEVHEMNLPRVVDCIRALELRHQAREVKEQGQAAPLPA